MVESVPFPRKFTIPTQKIWKYGIRLEGMFFLERLTRENTRAYKIASNACTLKPSSSSSICGQFSFLMNINELVCHMLASFLKQLYTLLRYAPKLY